MERRYQRTLLNREICDAHVAWQTTASMRASGLCEEYLMNGSIDSIKAKANIVRAGDARGRLLVHAFGFLAPALRTKFNSFSVSPWHDCLMPLSKNFRRSVLVCFVSSSSRSALNYFWASLHHGTSSLPMMWKWRCSRIAAGFRSQWHLQRQESSAWKHLNIWFQDFLEKVSNFLTMTVSWLELKKFP